MCQSRSHLGSLSVGRARCFLARSPPHAVPGATQHNSQDATQLTLQSTVLRICLSESLLRASVGFGWATMCWRLDLAIAFLEDTGGPPISSGEKEHTPKPSGMASPLQNTPDCPTKTWRSLKQPSRGAQSALPVPLTPPNLPSLCIASCALPYIQQPGAPAVGAAGGLRSQALGEGGPGCPRALLGQPPRAAGGQQPGPQGVTGAAALAQAAVAARQAVGHPAAAAVCGQDVGGGAAQAAGTPRQQPGLQRPQPGQHGQPALLGPPPAPLRLAARCVATAILQRPGDGGVGVWRPITLLSVGEGAGQQHGVAQKLGIDGGQPAPAVLLHGEAGAEAGRRGAGAAPGAAAAGQGKAGEGQRHGAGAAAALGQGGGGQPGLGAAAGFAGGHSHHAGTPRPR